jgi:hypothetical protein
MPTSFQKHAAGTGPNCKVSQDAKEFMQRRAGDLVKSDEIKSVDFDRGLAYNSDQAARYVSSGCGRQATQPS